MKTDVKIDGVMVLTGVAIIAAVVVAYKLKTVKDKVGQIVSDVVDIPVRAFNFVNDAVPPGITFDQKQPDGSIKKVTVSGAAIKQANANGANMGMVAWPTPSATYYGDRWWSGYEGLSDADKENPFRADYSAVNYDPVEAQKLMSGSWTLDELTKPVKPWSMF